MKSDGNWLQTKTPNRETFVRGVLHPPLTKGIPSRRGFPIGLSMEFTLVFMWWQEQNTATASALASRAKSRTFLVLKSPVRALL